MIENNASEKQKYFWNMMGSMCNALSTVILLFLVNTFLGSEQGGVFSFAYSNAQLMLIIGGLEVRPLQSTDVQEEYSFQLYYTLRIITCILMMCICIFYTIFSITSTIFTAAFPLPKNSGLHNHFLPANMFFISYKLLSTISLLSISINCI